jgi:cytochrome c oxidase cbb3-type subunit III
MLIVRARAAGRTSTLPTETHGTLRVLLCTLASLVNCALGQSPSTPNGQQIFTSNCTGCHGLDGKGGEHAPNIATDATVQSKSDIELARTVRNGIPSGGMPGFSKLLDDKQIAALLSYVRTLHQDENSTTTAGDAGSGRNLFFGAARCSECHMLDGRGGFLGADLSNYGRTHAPAIIRSWIVAPDRNSDGQHGAATAILHNGKKLRGLVRNEDNFSLQLQTLDGEYHFLDKSSLKLLVHEPHSLMPLDYAKTLTKSQLDDLVTFVSQHRGARPAAVADAQSR